MIGVVVVGTGFGCYTHVRALRAAGFDVKALVGRDPEKTARRAAMFDVPRACTSLDEALDIEGIDAVTIATPPGTHATLALEAIAHGRHVLCEKPFTTNAKEAQGVLAAAEEAGIVHLLGTEFRFDPGQALLARAVHEGLIGEPHLATWLMHVPMLADPGAVVPEWWADAGSHGGWLWAHGSQLIDQIRVTLGDFEGVSASLTHVVERPAMTSDDGFAMHFRCVSGATGVMASTAADWGVLVETRVTGSAGAAWIEGVSSTVKVADHNGVRTLQPIEDLVSEAAPPLPTGAVQTTYEQMITFGVEYWPYVKLAQAFADLIAGRTPAGPSAATFVDGLAQMRVLDAVMASAAGGGTWTTVAR